MVFINMEMIHTRVSERVGQQEQYQLTDEEIDRYNENGYLKLESVFDESELEALRAENDTLIQNADTGTDHGSAPIKTSDHLFKSGVWARAIQDPRITVPMTQLIGPNVELDHTTGRKWMPAETAEIEQHDLHQDRVFYSHSAETFINAIVYLDDFPEDEGGMRFIPGSHLDGDLEHVDGEKGPQLPETSHSFDETIGVPANAGDVILFHINVVHGTQVARQSDPGTITWVIYNDPAYGSEQAGVMVAGSRP
ncbi:Ectoine hydroxylase-related dioxygenase, phytanoyl-CoA dioxygenase (PhyH) family [Natronorubrum texcoconense]|uniref:Ectoine hydroxylase-related dioxygenase, phytanoyl-CoA dioxygenase (PhyH) family n=2 Tax=Natronorubrum texcoconense TaxID=1095776 RepID=A0A1G9FXR9_9EURY|nr:Ectoine hydroxylase-related dioxygenase, phytanoyl-CoA dioxygenase (PhyH) family [Natronorubrum texcoconense]